MAARLSSRLQAIVDALPVEPGMRVLEIGCGTGAATREVARRIGHGYVFGIDRSATAIDVAVALSRDEIAAGVLGFRQATAEEFALGQSEQPFDLAFAVRVGAFDGRHPQAGEKAKRRIKEALKSGAPFYIDDGNPLRGIPLDD